ncbi:hypothetical protein ADUPG1_002324, partial [Aduncisulcus paluster]
FLDSAIPLRMAYMVECDKAYFLKGFDDLVLDPRFPLSVSSRGVGSVAFTVRLPRLCTRWSDLVTSCPPCSDFHGYTLEGFYTFSCSDSHGYKQRYAPDFTLRLQRLQCKWVLFSWVCQFVLVYRLFALV